MLKSRVAARQAVELRVAHRGTVGRRKDFENGLLVDLIRLVADQYEVNRNGLIVHDELAWLEPAESVGVDRRGRSQTQSGNGEESLF